MKHAITIAAILLLVTTASAQLNLAQPTLPTATVDTTYSLPTGGTTRAAHTAAQFITALNAAVPGDVIVLDAGVTYSGNFTLPIKANPSNKWIYIISSDLASLPEHVRVTPASASHMPKLTTPGATTLFNMPNTIAGVSSNHWRLVGLELTTNSNYCPVAPCPANNYMSNGLIQQPFLNTDPPVNPQQHHLILDRVYAHGDATHDIQGAIALNVSYGAIIDSEISEIHLKGTDSWAAGGNWGAGPFKIVNNMLSASSENMIWGGSGKGALGNIPSDITITGNYFYKPLSWIPLSVGSHKMVVKNAFECKSCQRVLFDNNIIENVWADGQLGSAIVLTVRTAQSGDIAVVNDITISNNLLLNVARGVNTLAADDNCGIPPYTSCTNAGSQSRWWIYNNLGTFFDPTAVGGVANIAIAFQPGINRPAGTLGMMQNVIFQHNTFIQNGSHPCQTGVYLNNPTPTPPIVAAPHVTSNIWILDNVLCGLPTGPNGTTQVALNTYMGYPTTPPYSLAQRFYGNEMNAQGGSLTWPTGNLATNTAFTYNVNNIVTNPPWTTTAGPPAPPFQSGFMGLPGTPIPLSITVTPASPSITHPATQQFTAMENYSDGTSVDITAVAAWVSGTLGVATINSSGLATSVSAGSSIISASKDSLTGTATLTVNGAVVTPVSITVTPPTPAINLGSTQQFTAIENYSDGSTVDITAVAAWSSANSGIASVSGTGLATSVAVGSTAIYAEKDSLTGTATLTVNPVVTLLSVTLAPLNTTILLGNTQQYTATANYSDGSSVDVTTTATWASTVTGVATVNSTGLATSVAAGTTSISATYNSVPGSTPLTVVLTNNFSKIGLGGSVATSGRVRVK